MSSSTLAPASQASWLYATPDLTVRGAPVTRLRDGGATLKVGSTEIKVEADNTILFKSVEGETGAITAEQYGLMYAFLEDNKTPGDTTPQIYSEEDCKALRQDLREILEVSASVHGPCYSAITTARRNRDIRDYPALKEFYSSNYLEAQRGLKNFDPTTLMDWAVQRTLLLMTVNGRISGDTLDHYKLERLTMPLNDDNFNCLKKELQTNLDSRNLVIKDVAGGGLAVKSGAAHMQVLRAVNQFVLSGNVYGVLRAHHLVSNTHELLERKRDKASLPDFGLGQAVLGDADKPLRANIDRLAKHVASLRVMTEIVDTPKVDTVKARRAQHVVDLPLF